MDFIEDVWSEPSESEEFKWSRFRLVDFKEGTTETRRKKDVKVTTGHLRLG